MKPTSKEKQNAINYLQSIINPNDTIYTILRSVSSSGMSRRITLCLARKHDDGTIILMNLDWFASCAMGYPLPVKGQGLIVKGCGMDMGNHLVHSLGLALWPNGTPEPHGMRNGEVDSNGGYAIKQKWI